MNDGHVGDAQNPDRPRVLVVIRWPVGGIRTWCRYVYKDIKFSAYDIEILMPHMEEAVSLKRDLEGTQIKTTLVESGDSVASFCIAVANQIRRERYCLVHSHGFTSGLASVLPTAINRIPHLVTPHDVVLEDQYRDLRGWVVRKLLAALLLTATWVQPVGQAAADNLANSFPKSFGRKKNVCVVRNGIETARFLGGEAEEVRSTYGVPDDAILVGFFGRFMSQKGFRYLVEAVAYHKQSNTDVPPIVVLAVGGGGFRREEELAVKERGLENNFRFIDFTPNVAGLLKSVDVVAMPSLWEACPLLPMEALTAGTPIVISDCSACREIADDTPAMVVPMRDAKSLLEAILLMSTPEKRAESAKFISTAAKRFDIASTIAGILALYSRIIDPNRPSNSG